MTSRSKTAGPGAGRRRALSKYANRLKMWEAACVNLRATIQRLKDAPAPMGAEWRDRQVAYFERRLAELEAAKPVK